MIYKVAEGFCFGNKDKTYKAGDVITKDVFSPQEAFDVFIEKGQIVAVNEKPVAVEVKKEEVKVEEKAEEVVVSPKDGINKKKLKK